MATFQEQLQKAKKLKPNNVSNALFEYVRKFEREYAQYNRSQLYIDSKDVEGNPIGYYSPGTEAITKGRKKAGQPFDLFETGDLLGSLIAKVDVSQKRVEFEFKDPKAPGVFEKLKSDNILGLSDENLKVAAIEKAKIFLQNYYRKKLDL